MFLSGTEAVCFSNTGGIMPECNEKPVLLVINDNEGGRRLLVRVLEPYFKMEEAATGAAGLEKSLARPDLVLLDVNLPDISGFEVCARIKKDPLTAHLPVMHLSATSLDAASRATGLENGADAYLTLPVETEVLVATINSLLRIKKAEAALAAGNAQLATLSEIDRIFLSTRGAGTWTALLSAALDLFSSPGGCLGYLNENGEMVIGAAAGPGGLKKAALCGGEGLPPCDWKERPWAGAISSGAVLVDNAPSGWELPPGHVVLGRFLSVPLTDGGRVVGHLTVTNKAQDYTARDIASAKLVSGHIAALLKGRLDMERQEKRNRRMLVEMANMQKIESLGELAGGIAHDFNNFLAGITCNLSLLAARSDLGTEDKEAIKDMLAAAASAHEITCQLVTFSKGGQPVKKVFNFGEALASWCSFSMRGSRSRVEVSIAPGLWCVNGDECQLNQAANNLLRNALEAMPQGGAVKVTAENLEQGAAPGLLLPAGNYVRLSVADDGVGIQETHLDRIFDPYFTTKTQGHGLGLPMAYSIIKNHGGEIKARSLPGAGAEFTVYLPADKDSVPAARDVPAEVQKGSGCVLVMDDDEIMRKAARRMLTALGYGCVCAADGEEALKLYRAELGGPAAFKAVIMDLTIPGGMGGEEAVRKFLELDPRCKVVVSSGYSDYDVQADYVAAGFSAALSKPYKYEDLAAVLAKLLGQYSRCEGPAGP